jgi:3',5'-cyclic AMP phosphodiesterase CpdA
MRAIVLLTAIVTSLPAVSQQVVREPYLNALSQRSVVIRWRTDSSVVGQVTWEREGKKRKKHLKEFAPTAEHNIKISGLKPSAKYYYRIGSTESIDSLMYFRAAPVSGSKQPVRIWALGDFGNGSANQRNCFNAMLATTGNHPPDAWIWLGDNAYDFGSDDDYQRHVFDFFGTSFLQRMAIYPSPGNHDYRDNRENGAPFVAYYKIFSLPQQGEAGGVPSGSPAYYSVNYGSVHLVSLNSEEEINGRFTIADTSSAQIEWLKKDLAANRQRWTIVYLHRPPYTKGGSHDSDREEDLIQLRENLVPLLEHYNVDLVLAGHSHVYERTYPMRGHYGSSATFDLKKHVVDDSSGNGVSRRGIVYIVAGSGGQIDADEKGSRLPEAVYSNNDIGGSVLLDFSEQRLDVRWVCADGQVRDQFFIGYNR